MMHLDDLGVVIGAEHLRGPAGESEEEVDADGKVAGPNAGNLRGQGEQPRARLFVDGLDAGELLVGQLQLRLHPFELALETVGGAGPLRPVPTRVRERPDRDSEQDDQDGVFHGWCAATLTAESSIRGSINRR